MAPRAHSTLTHKLAAALPWALALIVAGCSSYEVRDTYVPAANESGALNFKQDGAALYIGVNPDTRFFAIGLLGAPLVPTYAQRDESKVIEIELHLTLDRDRDFSFAQRPCLTLEDQHALCPNTIGVSAIAMYQDDGSAYADQQKRWQKIADFHQAKSALTFTPQEDAARVDRARVYQHYGYRGSPVFGYLLVTVRYTYDCSDTCPKRLTFDTANLVSLENLSVPARSVHFERKQQRDYHASEPVQ